MKHPVIIINSDGKVGQISKLGIIARYLASTKGRHNLAQSLVNPIINRVDYSSLGRKVFLVEQLPPGALAIYDVAPLEKYEHKSIFIGSDGKIRTSRSQKGIFTKRVVLPGFQIMANPTISLSEIKTRRFDIIESIVDEVMDQEDSMIFETLKSVE